MVFKYIMSFLAEILSSRVREQVFLHLFDGQGRELHMRELERRSGVSIGTIQTELKKLNRLDLVVSRRDGNRLYYRANQEHPVYIDICSLVAKTSGIIGLLHTAVEDLPEITCAFLFGSLAEGTAAAQSDIDLMIIGSVGLRRLSAVFKEIAQTAGREINPYILSAQEFTQRVQSQDHFMQNVMKTSKIFIKGGEDDLAELAGQRLAPPA
jgi:DNA-binding transcriptional ArsR family regulator